MATTSHSVGNLAITLIAGSCGLLALAYSDWRSEVQAQTYRSISIDFDDTSSLRSLDPRWDAARFTFADEYEEDDMLFKDGVVPPDPALGGRRYGHYHLSYEDPEAFQAILRGDTRLDPATQPRLLQPHAGDHVIQMTFDPDGDGVPDPFNLISIEVLSGQLNIGVRGPFGIAVYNNLTAGFNWFLIDANNLTRATLEGTGSIFAVDNIVFEPAVGRRSIVAANAGMNDGPAEGELEFEELTDIDPVLLSPEVHDFIHSSFVRPVELDIVPGSCLIVLESESPDATLVAAILGSAEFDVMEVDPDTIFLEGVAPQSLDFEDVATPLGPFTREGCADAEPDGFVDMLLHFDTQEVLDATGSALEDLRTLELTGALFDGTLIQGADVVIVPTANDEENNAG